MVKILLAEDDPSHCQLIQLVLARERPEISLQCVGSGADCLQMLQQQDFDCILLDFNLPDYRADEVLQLISEKPDHCPVIVISSSDDQEVVIRSMRNGSIDFIPKSEAMDGTLLWQRVEAALLKHHKVERERRQMVRRVKRLSQLAETDPLTGLSNRLYLERILSGQRQIYDRRGPISCVLMDLDHFKSVNDTYGHLAGDTVLCETADVLKENINRGDVACRWGGEEFLVLLSSRSAGEALVWAQCVRKLIASREITYEGKTLRVTASFGVVTCAGDKLNVTTLAEADQALYLAKHFGRNCVCSGARVALHDIVRDVCRRFDLSPEQRVGEVLRRADGLLGPTQREHLTDHSRRVSELAVRLGQALNLDIPRLDGLRLAGLCHDLGKFIIPEDLLSKPETLSPEERELISRHARDGAIISQRLGVDGEVARYIRYHHKRLDQQTPNGEPKGTIPLGARVLAVADAFVAMTTPRPYHAVRSTKDAIRELQQHRGTQFDPNVVDVLEQTITS